MPDAQIIPFPSRPVRPDVPVPNVSAGPADVRPIRARPRTSDAVPGVWMEWDPAREVYQVVCRDCCEAVMPSLLEDAHEWAETHRCDSELAALFEQIAPRKPRAV